MAIDVEVTAKLLTNGDLLVFGKDISERKKAETQITESEQRLIRAEKMGSLGHGFYEFEKDKITLSAGLYDIFGVSPDSFSHTLDGLLSVIHPGDKAIQEKALETLLLNGEVEVEFRIQTPDGEIRNVQFKTVLSKNSNGEFINSFTTAIDLTESRKAEEKIRKNNDQLRQLAANLQNIREKERARIGREIHDELGQWLTVLKMEISRVNKIKNDETKLNEAIEEMLSQVDGCIQSSRKISTELRPTLIDDLGLIAALEWQAEEFEKRTGIHSAFTTGITDLDIPPDYTIALFRIFQESLTNVARHSDATSVKSEFYIDEGNIILKIIDDGKGFDATNLDSRKTLGLIGMQERTLLMNGSYEIHSAPGKGTEIRVIIPLPFG
jgi:signal transduction histidine kinase